MAKAARTQATPKNSGAIGAEMRIVVLHGKDSFLRVERSRLLQEALEAAHGAVDRFVLDGAVARLDQVLDELRTYGLMAGHKLVVVDNAEQFMASEERRRAMERYAEAPMAEATLLMRAQGQWRPGNFDKLVAKVGAVLKCDAPSDDEARRWCVARAQKEHRAVLESDAAELLVERVGADLARLDSELGKLAVAAAAAAAADASASAGAATITRAVVHQFVGLSREEQAWEIQEPLLRGSPPDALKTLHELIHVSRAPEVMLAWSVTDVLRKVHDAARMLAQGEPEGSVAKALRLWGPAQFQVMKTARSVGSARAAALLGRAIDTELRMRRGLSGDDERTLQGLVTTVAGALA